LKKKLPRRDGLFKKSHRAAVATIFSKIYRYRAAAAMIYKKNFRISLLRLY
jgi:hypothetical protein